MNENETNAAQIVPPTSASGCSVFEVVDATDDENYFTLGVFLSLADAMREVESCDAPDDLGGDHGDHEECCVVEVRERKIGWGGIGREVARYEWKTTYDEAADEYGWIRTQTAIAVGRPVGDVAYMRMPLSLGAMASLEEFIGSAYGKDCVCTEDPKGWLKVSTPNPNFQAGGTL